MRCLPVLACLLSSALLYAAPGDLDTSFGVGKGWVSTGFRGLGAAFGADTLQQADGKLVVAGYSYNGNNYDFALVRYNTDGTLDTTFSGTGKLATDIGASDDSAQSVIQQTDGKLVVAGSSYNGNNYDFALVRYNTDGTLDTTFGGTGKIVTTIGAVNDHATSVIQQADGKLVAAGYSYNSSYNFDFALVRYNADGTLDTTFNGTGKLTTEISAGRRDTAQSVIQQADGKLVAAGDSNNDFALVRYNPDGTLDTTFNGSGKLTTHVYGADEAYSVIQQADGKLVAAGNTYAFYQTTFAVVRYNANGTLDTTFNGSGKRTASFGYSHAKAYSVIQQADGNLVAAGYNDNGNNYDFALVRFNVNGTLDTTFNGTGQRTMAIGNGYDAAGSVIQQTDGKLAVAGYSANDGIYDFAMVRYNADGTLDTGFDGDGKATTAILGYSTDAGRSVIQQVDGKLVVAGSSLNNGFNDGSTNHRVVALARYHADGSPDTTLNGTGQIITGIGAGNTGDGKEHAQSVIQQADGKLVVAGQNYNVNSYDFALARYDANGDLDATFNGTGQVATDIGAITDDGAQAVIQQADGKLVAVGSSYNGNSYDFALVRYNVNGSLDVTFDGDGKLITAIGAGSNSASSVIQQTDGKLVMAGYSYNGTNDDFTLVRYNANGSLDTTFNSTGQLTVAIGNGYDQLNSVIQQADGKLVAVGSSYNGNSYDFALVRYNANGSLDATFDGDGKLTTDIGGLDDYAYSVVQQGDGKLVVAGYSANGINDDFTLVRYNADGSLDTTFNGTGKLTMDLDTGDDRLFSLLQQADGKLVVAGYAQGMPTGQEFVVARFESGQLDSDGDGWVNGLDTDNDGDGIDNNIDIDDDNDGVPDYIDADPLDAGASQERVLPLDSPYSGSAISETVSP